MTGPETVLVAGPPRAGVSGVVAELRRRMPSHRFVEAGETGAPQRPAVVVFVVSAVAPITRSDCELADRVAASTDAVVAVLAKIDPPCAWSMSSGAMSTEAVLMAARSRSRLSSRHPARVVSVSAK